MEFVASAGPGCFRGIDGKIRFVNSEGCESSLEAMCAQESAWAAQYIQSLQELCDQHLKRIDSLSERLAEAEDR